MKAEERAYKHIERVIDELKLDLSGLTVLTEIGNNYYYYLPFIAAMAGAKKVYAWTGNNNYFDVEVLVKNALEECKRKALANTISFAVNERPATHVQQADIITNSGFVRPLNESLLKNSKDGVAIPLMFEAWELRETDIDITYCKKRKIKVAGTNENHPAIKVFESVGPLAVKLAMEAGMEVYQNKIIVWSDDAFGEMSKTYFEKMNATDVLLTTNKEKAIAFMPDADFIYFCSNHEKRCIISNQDPDAIFSIDAILNSNPSLNIVHLYGKFDLMELESKGLHVYPKQNGKSEYMSKTLTHIGMGPSLNLLVAGLKVGQEMARNNLSDLTQMIL